MAFQMGQDFLHNILKESNFVDSAYSLLMADDEIHTIETLKKYRKIMSDIIQQHSGRVVDNPGDNLLAEFSSAVDAVRCQAPVAAGGRMGRDMAGSFESADSAGIHTSACHLGIVNPELAEQRGGCTAERLC